MQLSHWSGKVCDRPLEQRIEVSLPLGGYQAELTRVATNGVAQLRAIADQPVTDAHQHQGRLLLSRFHRHEAHWRPAHRLAKCFSIRRIILFTIRPVGDVYIMLLLSGQVAQAYFAVWPSP